MFELASQGDLVGDVMVRKVATISPDKKLCDAAKLMEKRQIGSVVVVRDRRVIGILTERDFVRLAAAGYDVKTARIMEVMRRRVVTCSPYIKCWDAYAIMRKENVGHLPVVFKGKLVGMITPRDLIAAGKLI